MDPTSQKGQQKPRSGQSLSSSFSSSSLRHASQHPKRIWRSSKHREPGPFAPTKAPDPPRVDPHLQAKAMTLSANSGPSRPGLRPQPNPLLLLPPQKELEAMTVGRPTVNHSTEMDKKGASLFKCKSVSGGFGGGKGGDGEADEKRLVVSEVGGRRSFCGSDVEVGGVFAGLGARIVAKDMPPFMQIHAATCARKTYDALEKFSAKALAFTLKKEFDAVYGPAWHCIVGTSFGSFVTHSVGGFLYFSLDKLHVLLFKTTVQRAD